MSNPEYKRVMNAITKVEYHLDLAQSQVKSAQHELNALLAIINSFKSTDEPS